MPNRVQWNPGYSTGNDILDSQHRAILAQCNTLADCLADAGADSEQKFHNTFQALMAQAGEHFSSEETLLTQCGYPLLEEHRDEHDEFDYLAADIITTENFEKVGKGLHSIGSSAKASQTLSAHTQLFTFKPSEGIFETSNYVGAQTVTGYSPR